ncbi:DoxX family protein [Streptomyces sp. B1866]|uniref:DoxX family protein n=1 Tax=Streptomyces sp. B1866 TaxID=3075431 RepID=UPI0028915090|nr:DoxX family protein [Streptomyces sp. B1866]MDT3400442.1 DoxX family protein [Streptomyces sp. B1866]
MSPSALPTAVSERLDAVRPHVVSLFRIVIGLLFLCHGGRSLLGWFDGVDGSGGTVEAGDWPGWYAAVIQLVGGGLVLLGLGTRSAAFLSSGSMAYAYFVEHQPEKLWPIENNGELSALFCWALLLIVFTGPGPWSLDRVLGAGRPSAAASADPADQEARAV